VDWVVERRDEAMVVEVMAVDVRAVVVMVTLAMAAVVMVVEADVRGGRLDVAEDRTVAVDRVVVVSVAARTEAVVVAGDTGERVQETHAVDAMVVVGEVVMVVVHTVMAKTAAHAGVDPRAREVGAPDVPLDGREDTTALVDTETAVVRAGARVAGVDTVVAAKGEGAMEMVLSEEVAAWEDTTVMAVDGQDDR